MLQVLSAILFEEAIDSYGDDHARFDSTGRGDMQLLFVELSKKDETIDDLTFRERLAHARCSSSPPHAGEVSVSPGLFRVRVNLVLDLCHMIAAVTQRVVDLRGGQMRVRMQYPFHGPVVPVLADHMAHHNIRSPNMGFDTRQGFTLYDIRVLGLDFRRHRSPVEGRVMIALSTIVLTRFLGRVSVSIQRARSVTQRLTPVYPIPSSSAMAFSANLVTLRARYIAA